METRAFAPLYLKTSAATAGGLIASVTLAATAASQQQVLPGNTSSNSFCQIQIANQGTTWAFVNFGLTGSVPAATVAASYPVAPGSVVIVSLDSEINAATCILASGTGSVTFTRGEGL